MKSYTLLILAGIISFEFALTESALSAKNNEAGVPTIAITSIDVNDTTLKLSYDIRNESGKDVWILVGFGKTEVIAEVFMDTDDRTL
ncbi:MAG: hypothetical protein ACYTEW_02610 [Planctomycetota bacterium]